MRKKVKRRTDEEKIVILDKIKSHLKTKNLTESLKEVSISDATYYKWKAKIKSKLPALTKQPTLSKVYISKKNELVTIPMNEEKEQPMIVLMGPAEMIRSSLAILAQISRG